MSKSKGNKGKMKIEEKLKTEKLSAEAKKENRLLSSVARAVNIKTKSDYTVLGIGVILVVLMVVLAVLLFMGVFKTKASVSATAVYYGRDETVENLSEILISEDEQKILSKKTKLDFDNAKFDFYALTEIEYSDSDKLLPLTLSNPSYNECTIIFSIVDGEGNLLYRSLGIKPGYSITNVNFSKNISYGKCELKLYATAFDSEKKKNDKEYYKIGNSIATIKVTHNSDKIG